MCDGSRDPEKHLSRRSAFEGSILKLGVCRFVCSARKKKWACSRGGARPFWREICICQEGVVSPRGVLVDSSLFV